MIHDDRSVTESQVEDCVEQLHPCVIYFKDFLQIHIYEPLGRVICLGIDKGQRNHCNNGNFEKTLCIPIMVSPKSSATT